MWPTGRLVKIEVPRSPFSTCQTQSPKRTRNGRSSPSEARMRADVLRARLVAGDDRRGIARGDIQQAEHEQRHHRHDRNGGQDPPRGVSEHYSRPLRSALNGRRRDRSAPSGFLHAPEHRERRLHHAGDIAAPRLVHLEKPGRCVGHVSNEARLMAAIACFSAGRSGATYQSAMRASTSGEFGQPNHALSPPASSAV